MADLAGVEIFALRGAFMKRRSDACPGTPIDNSGKRSAVCQRGDISHAQQALVGRHKRKAQRTCRSGQETIGRILMPERQFLGRGHDFVR